MLFHVLGDFYFQTNTMASKKESRRDILLGHCVEYSLCMLPLLFIWGFTWRAFYAFIMVCASHAAIEVLLKPFVTRLSPRGIVVFFADQFLHLAACFLCAALISPLSSFPADFAHLFHEIVPMLLALLIAIKPSGVMVRLILDRYRYDKDGACKAESAKNCSEAEAGRDHHGAGEAIGWLERLLVVVLTAVSDFSAIAFVVTAKSIARFKRIEEDPEFAETYLIGTLSSVSIAMLTTLFIFWCSRC